MKRVLVTVGCLALAAIALLFLIPTFIAAFEGGFRWREVRSETSPDGRFQVIVRKRIVFPANEWIDPSVVIHAELRDVGAHRVLTSDRKILEEDSDFSTLAVRVGHRRGSCHWIRSKTESDVDAKTSA